MSRWRLIFSSLLAAVVLSAVASASASALEFYNAGGELITGELAITGSGGEQALSGTLAGVKIEINCTSLSAHGTIHNGLGEGGMLMGLGEGLTQFSGCTITAPKPKTVEGCEIPGGKITLEGRALAITVKSEPYIEFRPKSGTVLVEIAFVNCKTAGLDGEYEVTGILRSKVNNATSELETNTGEGELVFGGKEAKCTGNAKQVIEGGGRIKVE